MELPPSRVYQSQVEDPKPASRQVHIVIFMGLGVFCLLLSAAIVLCLIAGGKARAEDVESLRAIGGVRYTMTKSARRADRKALDAATAKEKERLAERGKRLDAELVKIGRTVQPPAPTLKRQHEKTKPVRVARSQYKLSAKTPRKRSLPPKQMRAQMQTQQVKRKKSTLKEKEKNRIELERKDKEIRNRKEGTKRSALQ